MTADDATVLRGAKHPLARLSDEAVRIIRTEYAAGGVTQQALAERYGVSLMLINGIVRGKRWKHVTDVPESEVAARGTAETGSLPPG